MAVVSVLGQGGGSSGLLSPPVGLGLLRHPGPEEQPLRCPEPVQLMSPPAQQGQQ